MIHLFALIFCFSSLAQSACFSNPSPSILDGPFYSDDGNSFVVNSSRAIFFTDTSVYRTSDGGATFERLDDSTLVNYSTPFTANSLFWDPQSGWLRAVQSSDPRIMIIFGHGGQRWQSSDGGSTFTSIKVDYELRSVYAHPTNPNFFLAAAYNQPCCAPGSGCEFSCAANLLFSNDGGLIFATLPFYGLPLSAVSVLKASWGTGNNVFVLNGNNLLYSTDFFLTQQFVLGSITQYLDFPEEELLVTLQTASDPLSLVYVSGDNSFKYVKSMPLLFSEIDNTFPIRVIQSDANNTFTVVAKRGSPNTVQLYVTDTREDSEYFLSLPFVRRVGTTVDFVSVANISQIFVANTFQNNEITSRITFNAGASWQPLALSPSDFNACGIAGCSLHFFGPTNAEEDIFKGNTQTPGWIVVKGCVGTSRTCTAPTGIYMSNDAGQTWSSTQFSYPDFSQTTYDVSDSAQYMAVVTTQAAAVGAQNNITYSSDGGQTVFTCLYNDPATDLAENRSWRVISIQSDADSNANPLVSLNSIYDFWVTSQFTINNATGTFQGFQIFPIDLGNDADCTIADYTTFSLPKSSSPNPCVMGELRQYQIKNLSASCVASFPTLTTSQPSGCTCTSEDFYCSFCYIKNSSGACVFDTLYNPYCGSTYINPETPSPFTCVNPYVAPAKYNTVFGDKCTYNATTGFLATTLIPCPPIPPTFAPTLSNATKTKPHVTSYIFYVIIACAVVAFLIFMVVAILAIRTDRGVAIVNNVAGREIITPTVHVEKDVELSADPTMSQVDLSHDPEVSRSIQ